MVKRTIQTITSKISGLGEAAFWLSLFGLFSQILALFRDRLLAHNFGAAAELDVYYAAFKIPDLAFVTVASLVSISALVPLFAKKETEGERHLKDATDSIFTVFSVLIIVFCVALFFLMPAIIKLSFPGFSPGIQAQTIFLSRILLFSPLLLGFSNFFGSIVQYEKRFILYSFSPLLYNIGIIAGIALFNNALGITSAVIGVVFGALLHLLLQAVFVMRSHLRPRWTISIKWIDVLETAKISIPRTFALSIASFVGFFFVILASFMETGSIAIFNFSWNLQSAPLSLIGVSFSLAAFPALAVSAAKNHIGEVIERMSSGIRQIIFWSLPFSALLIVLRAHIVRVVLGSGSFDWAATRLVAASLAVFVISAVFQSLTLFLSRSHYALGKTKWPLVGNIFGGVFSVLIAIFFIKYFDDFNLIFNFLADFLNISDLSSKILLLPLAYSIGSAVSALILFLALGRKLALEIFRLVRRTVLNSSLIALSSGVGSYFALSFSDHLFNLETFLGVLGHGFLAGIVGIACGAAVLYFVAKKDLTDLIYYEKKH